MGMKLPALQTLNMIAKGWSSSSEPQTARRSTKDVPLGYGVAALWKHPKTTLYCSERPGRRSMKCNTYSLGTCGSSLVDFTGPSPRRPWAAH